MSDSELAVFVSAFESTGFVPNVEVVNLDCDHWIQQEKPEETNQAILKWLEQQGAT